MLGGTIGLHRWCLPGDTEDKMTLTLLGIFSVLSLWLTEGTAFMPFIICFAWAAIDFIVLIICDDDDILEVF